MVSTAQKLLIGGFRRVSSALVYLFRDEFTTDAAAPLTSPRTAEPGTLTIVDTGNKLSISGGALTLSSGTGNSDPRFFGAAQSDAVGRAVFSAWNSVGTDNRMIIGWGTGIAIFPADGLYFNSTGVLNASNNNNGVSLGTAFASATNYSICVSRRSAGNFVFIKGGVFTNWTLLFITASMAAANIFPGGGVASAGANGGSMSHLRVRDLPSPFNTDDGIATLVVSSPVSGAAHVGAADHLTDLVYTAPNPLSNSGELWTRVNGTTYWRSYFNSAGAFRADSVSAGVGTNRVNVAAVIAAAGTATIREIAEGSLHDFYTLSGTTWTKRGSQVNVSLNNSEAAINATYTDYVPGSLKSYPRTSAVYTAALDAA